MAWTVEDQADPHAIALFREWQQTRQNDDFLALFAIFREDFPSFCALLLRVRPKGGGTTVPFLFNQVQRRIWREIAYCIAHGIPPWFVILKFRQAGMSTFWCAWMFWQIWRQTDLQTMIIAHQMKTAETMIENMRVFYDELPLEFRPELREGNHGATVPRGEVYFADRRSWTILHLAKDVDPRGQQVTHVLETEHAMYPNPEEMNGALLPQLPTFGSEARLRSSVVIESTPKGQNDFYDLYWEATKGEISTFRALFFPWFLFEEQYSAEPPPEFRLTDEERKIQAKLSRMRMHEYKPEDGGGKSVTRAQMYWRRETIRTEMRGNVDRFDQEYPQDDTTCFLLASKSVFRQYARYLDDCVHEAAERASVAWSKVSLDGGKPVEANGPLWVKLNPHIQPHGQWTPISRVDFEINPHGKWKVWEPPVDGHLYVIGGDPAMGLEDGDNSACCVLDVTAARQVAEFADEISPERFAVEMAAAGMWYNNALLVPEINMIGYVVLNRLIAAITYSNLYKWPKFDEVYKFTHKRGWETTVNTKQLLVSSMVNYVHEQIIAIASKDLLGEMSTYERIAHSDYYEFRAQRGRYDDRVMAFGLAIMGIDQTPLLATELQRAAPRIPSIRDLGLAASDDRRVPPIPAKLIEKLTQKYPTHWNPMREGDIF